MRVFSSRPYMQVGAETPAASNDSFPKFDRNLAYGALGAASVALLSYGSYKLVGGGILGIAVGAAVPVLVGGVVMYYIYKTLPGTHS